MLQKNAQSSFCSFYPFKYTMNNHKNVSNDINSIIETMDILSTILLHHQSLVLITICQTNKLEIKKSDGNVLKILTVK